MVCDNEPNMRYNIFSKLTEEIADYETGGVYLVGKPSSMEHKQAKKGEKGGYYYSQRDTLESIDLASASKYKTGIRDKEGQRKAYINIVNFFRDVMKMKINIDVSNYMFEPTSDDFTWPVFLMDRQFKQWAADESYDDEIDEYAHDLSTYGTTVNKKLSDCTERVPLRTMRNSQTAKSLWHATNGGGYVHIDNDYHYNQIKDYPGWDLTGFSKNKVTTVTERYALVPKKLLQGGAWKTTVEVEITDDDEMVAVQAILAPYIKDPKGETGGKILFMEKVDCKSFPLEECHAEKVDGRWLGRGEIEKQLENQIARNLTVNLRRRGLLWATKKVYQSTDDEVQKNLVMEVQDGDVLKVKPNGTISQVNTQSLHLADFQQDDNAWKENSQQNAFAFNATTGEDLPSGTSFSLGVMLAKQVSDHFKLVRATFSNFLKRAFFDQLIPIFQEEYSHEHTLQIPVGATDVANLQESITIWHVNLRLFNSVLKGQQKSIDDLRAEVQQEQSRNPYLFVTMPKDFYPKAGYYMKLNLVDDIGPDIASLTTLYQALSAKNDPRADTVLKLIFARQGKTLAAIAGVAPRPQAQPQQIPGNQGNTGAPVPSNIQTQQTTTVPANQ